jgi:hypothetical protein
MPVCAVPSGANWDPLQNIRELVNAGHVTQKTDRRSIDRNGSYFNTMQLKVQ